MHALTETADAWRHSFERRAPQRAELALALVGDDSDRVPLGRECAFCGKNIPPERGRHGPAKYCSDACRKTANNAALYRRRKSAKAAA